MINTRLKVGEYEAWLVVENAEVEHYGIEVNGETNVATCWIASTAGKHFGLWVAKRHDKFDCAADVYLDGSWMCRYQLIKWPRLVEHALIGESSVRPFLFGVLNLTEDESVPSTQSYEELGSIKVVMHHVTRGEQSSPRCVQVSENDQIHERAKKSVTHRVSFGQTKKLEKKSTYVNCLLQEKVATFVFRYRSLDLLRANEIAPRSPSNVETTATEVVSSAAVSADKLDPVSRKRKATVKEEETVGIESEDEEYNLYKSKEAELEAELERIRKAHLDHRQGKHVKKKVKHEPKPAFLPGEIIDLTI